MRRLAALLAAAAVVATACDRSIQTTATPAISPSAVSPSVASPRETVEEPPGGGLPDVAAQPLVTGEAGRLMADLCVPPELGVGGEAPEPGPVDQRIAEVEDQVAEIRGLRWLRPVVAQPIDDAEMDRRIDEAFAAQFPADLYDRRTLAWQTIGAIGSEDHLRDALLAFGRGQVVGFYDPQNGELVYLADEDGGGELGLTAKAVLAHELVHALDDQHFDLRRVDTLVSGCRDEEVAAALGVVEGSAQHFATQVLLRYPAPLDEGLLDALAGGGIPDEVPPFVAELQLLSYTEGQAFVSEIVEDDPGAADAALEDLPPTTEQILHPERWPDDEPTAVEPVDLRLASAEGWRDLDVMQIGELWLRELLRLRIDETVADEAAAGWDGGAYRAWHRPSDDAVAVTMRTVWDSPDDAEAFADAMRTWIDAGGTDAQVASARATVDVVFVRGDVAVASFSGG